MNEPIDNGRTAPMPGSDFVNQASQFTLQKMFELMEAPVRAIETCMTKQQLKTVAKQTLAQNLALQTQVASLQQDTNNLREENRELKREIMILRDTAKRGGK